MTRVLVQSNRWGYGGVAVVFFHMISSLAKAGFDVYVYTFDRPHRRNYEEVMGEPLPENVKILSSRLSATGLLTIYKPFLSRLFDGRWKGFDARVVGDVYFTRDDAREVPTIYYIHFPLPLVVEGPWGFTSKYYPQPFSRGMRGFARSLIWWLYGRPYKFLTTRAYREMIESSRKNFVNSRFTLKAYLYSLTLYDGVDKEGLKRKVEVLNPPLPRSKRLLELRRENRVPCVLSLGRFSEEKRYELVLEVARKLKDYRFYIAGGVTGRASMLYYERIARSRPHNVTVAANVSEGLKEALLSRCQVYLHTMVGEHFGIAPLEALAAGATPVVHRFSGTWTDVCDERYCYDFKTTDPEEVAEKVQNALEKPRTAPVEHIERFSPELFGRRIVRAVEEALSI